MHKLWNPLIFIYNKYYNTPKDFEMFKNTSLKPFEKHIYLSSPTMHGEELKYMQEAYTTNWMSTIGKNIDTIEQLAEERIKVNYAVGLGTGTAALHLCMKLAGEKLKGEKLKEEQLKGKTADRREGLLKGIKVACSDMTFSATVNPVSYEGGEQVFIDTEEDSWNMDPKALERAFELHPDIKAVVVANLYGTPAKLDEIKAICDKHNAIMIEDAAESLGATYKGIPTGSFGHFNAISFHANIILTGCKSLQHKDIKTESIAA